MDCASAAERSWHGFMSGCRGCAARAIARGPNYHASRAQGSLTRPYIDELLRFDLTHDDVRRAAEADAVSRIAA